MAIETHWPTAKFTLARSKAPGKLSKTETLDTLAVLAGKIITAFLASDLTSLDGTIRGVEEELRGKLLDGVPDLLGRVDLLLEDHDTVSVVDFKTARSACTPDQASDNSQQLMLYCDLVRRLLNHHPTGIPPLLWSRRPRCGCRPMGKGPSKQKRPQNNR